MTSISGILSSNITPNIIHQCTLFGENTKMQRVTSQALEEGTVTPVPLPQVAGSSGGSSESVRDPSDYGFLISYGNSGFPPGLITTIAGENIIDVLSTSKEHILVCESGQMFRFNHEPTRVQQSQQENPKRLSIGARARVLRLQNYENIQANTLSNWRSGDIPNLSSTLEKLKTLPKLESNIKSLVTGKLHTVALLENGTVWSWGSNQKKTIGLPGQLNQLTDIPTQIINLKDQNVMSISAGDFHSAAVTEDGRLWTWGNNEQGQLCNGRFDTVFVCHEVKLSPEFKVKKVICKEDFTMVLVTKYLQLKEEDASHSLLALQDQLELINLKEASIRDYESSIAEREQIVIVQEHQLSEIQHDSRTLELTKALEQEKLVKKILECPVCMKIFSTRIHMCANGHSICDSCRNQPTINTCPECRREFSSIFNIALESLSERYEVFCDDCNQRMVAKQITLHEKVCPQRKINCLVEGRNNCPWTGVYSEVLHHTQTKHPTKHFNGSKQELQHSDFNNATSVFLISAFGELFILTSRYVTDKEMIVATLQYVGSRELALQFSYEIEVGSEDENDVMTFKKKVLSDGDILEDILKTKQAVNIPSCIAEFGGLDTIFSYVIKIIKK